MRVVGRGLLVVVVIAGAVAFGRPWPAQACSCVGDRPVEESIASADGAFVGRVVRIDGPGVLRRVFSTMPEADFRFAVEGVAKGRMGRTVVVRAGTSSASCGLDARVGDRLAMFVSPAGDGRWQGSLCGSVGDPDELAARSSPPDPSAPGPPPPGASTRRLLLLGVASGGIVALGVVTGRRARTRHDPASPTAAGS